MKDLFILVLRCAIKFVGNPLRCTACLMMFNSCNSFCWYLIYPVGKEPAGCLFPFQWMVGYEMCSIIRGL